MILRAIALLAVAYVLLWLSGEAVARACFGPRFRNVARFARLPFGLAALTCALELVGYFLPLRIGAWLVLALPLAGAVVVWKNRRGALRGFGRVAPVAAIAIGLGAWPIVIARRLALASLTNHDATFYITIADRLQQIPWREKESWLAPGECLREIVLHNWYWRTGTANLAGSLATWAGVDTPAALTLLVALLTGCIPWSVLAIAHAAAPAVVRRREALVALFGTLAAAPLFLAWQHLDGQLGAFVLFPPATAAILGALRHGGVRRAAAAAVWLGAALAHLADGAPLLVAFAVAGLACAPIRRSAPRALAVAVATCLVAPFTVTRAAHAAYNTMHYRVGAPAPLFPQLGWLHLPWPDALTIIAGVDPWPPWPLGWPLTLTSIGAYAGALGALVCVVAALYRLRSSRQVVVVTTVVVLFVVTTGACARSDYFVGKVLLMASAYVIPAVALGAAIWTRGVRFAGAAVLVADLAALGQLGRPGAWHVVDRPDHDRLVPELARIPRGSLVVLDGFGAPTDSVLDEHRAYRAAFLAGATVVQPGLDGMFYKPHCRTPESTSGLPPQAFALQRSSTEHLSRGKVLSRFGEFTLLAVDRRARDQTLATWAPMDGFIRAEREPDGTVFRWAGPSAHAAIWIDQAAPCARLAGEARTAGAIGELALAGDGNVLFAGPVNSVWKRFQTRLFLASSLRDVDLTFATGERAPPDAAHAVALRSLAIVPDEVCGEAVAIGRAGRDARPPFSLGDGARFDVLPAVGVDCARIGVQVRTDTSTELGVKVGSDVVVWQVALPGRSELSGSTLRVAGGVRVEVTRRATATGAVQVLGCVVHPTECRR